VARCQIIEGGEKKGKYTQRARYVSKGEWETNDEKLGKKRKHTQQGSISMNLGNMVGEDKRKLLSAKYLRLYGTSGECWEKKLGKGGEVRRAMGEIPQIPKKW